MEPYTGSSTGRAAEEHAPSSSLLRAEFGASSPRQLHARWCKFKNGGGGLDQSPETSVRTYRRTAPHIRLDSFREVAYNCNREICVPWLLMLATKQGGGGYTHREFFNSFTGAEEAAAMFLVLPPQLRGETTLLVVSGMVDGDRNGFRRQHCEPSIGATPSNCPGLRNSVVIRKNY